MTTNQQKDALNYQEYRFPIERSEHLNCSIKPKGEILNYNKQALGIRISKTVKLNEYQCIKPNVFLKEPHQISFADTSKTGGINHFNISLKPSYENIKNTIV